MHRATSLAVSTALLVALSTGSAVAAPAASATLPIDGTAGTQLPLSGFSHIVADPTHGHEFISGGIGTNGVELVDTAGAVIETIPGLPGASGMALSPNGTKLYVALGNGDGIAQLDTGTLRVKKFAVGAGTCPASVALAAGLVWFGYGCSGGLTGGIGTLDPGTGTVHLSVVYTGNVPAIIASPAMPGAIFEATPDSSSDFLTRYAVTGGEAPSATQSAQREVDGFYGDMALTPDGKDLLVADSVNTYDEVFSTSDLSSDGVYQASNHVNAVAISPQGEVAAGDDDYNTAGDVSLYRPGASLPDETADFGDGYPLADAGLAFGQSALFAVTNGPDWATYTLQVVPLGSFPDAPLTIGLDKTRYAHGATAHLKAHLQGGTPDMELSVYATPRGLPARIVRRADLDSNGNLHATFRMTRRTTFRVEYGGGTTFGFTSVQRQVTARAGVTSRIRGAYLLSPHHYHLVHIHRTPSVNVRLAPSHAGECVSFQVQRATPTGWKQLGTSSCKRLSPNSSTSWNLTEPRHIGIRDRVRARWGGDRENAASTGTWQYLRFTR